MGRDPPPNVVETVDDARDETLRGDLEINDCVQEWEEIPYNEVNIGEEIKDDDPRNGKETCREETGKQSDPPKSSELELCSKNTV